MICIFNFTCLFIFTNFITDRPARSAAMPVLFLLSGPKIGFSPLQRHVSPINMKFGTGSRPCQISRLSGQKCGNTAPKTVKISTFGHKFTPQGSLVSTIFMKFSDFCTRIQVDFKYLIWLLFGNKQPSYKNFPTVGEFSLKFSIASSGKTTDWIKKVRGCKNGTDFFFHYAKYGEDS